MATILLKPNEMNSHIHNEESFSMLIQGEVTINYNENTIEMHRNTKIIIPANTIHTMCNIGKSLAIIDCSHHQPAEID